MKGENESIRDDRISPMHLSKALFVSFEPQTATVGKESKRRQELGENMTMQTYNVRLYCKVYVKIAERRSKGHIHLLYV